jgi:TonB family protein
MAESYTAVGDFLLLKQRSQDGLGTLWRAGELERAGFRRIVWLRLFDQAGLDRTALEAEAPVVQQLSQAFKATNVVRNTTFAMADGVPCLAYDYVAGQPLDQLLSRVARDQFPVAVDNALLIVEKLSAALCAALAFELRGEPLVHGFLVPHLVIVGNDGEAMVAGFGLAKGLLANLDRVAVQELAAPYLAPEVLETYAPSRRADVYSLGTILYQLLCGHPLPAEPAQRAAALAAPQLALDEGPMPADIVAILRKSLADLPEDRYSSAVDFKRDLEKLLYGGAYSPTTFNLALFMDRLYRQDIEEEDRDLQRERTIDVTPYYRPPKVAGEAPVAAAPASRTGLYVAGGAIVILLAVVGFLLFGRPAAQSPQNVADLIQSEVTRQLAAKEAQLRAELDREKQETDKLRQQLAAQQKPGASVAPSEAQRRQQEELQRQIAAREEEQRKREDELRKVQQQRAQAESQVAPTAVAVVPTSAPVVPTAVPQPTAAPKAVATRAPERAEAVTPTAVGVTASLTPTRSATTVREGDLVDFTQIDTAPEVLIDARPTLSRTAARSRARGVVIVSVLVDEKGLVDSVKVLRGFPTPRLGVDEACVEAAKQYRFRPATKDGVNVKTWYTLTFGIDLSKTR